LLAIAKISFKEVCDDLWVGLRKKQKWVRGFKNKKTRHLKEVLGVLIGYLSSSLAVFIVEQVALNRHVKLISKYVYFPTEDFVTIADLFRLCQDPFAAA